MIFILALIPAFHCVGQLQQTPINVLQAIQDSSARPVVVFIQTDWCKYCAAMKQTTLKNGEVIDLLNKEFYFTPINGEMKTPVNWKGNTYNFRPSGNNTGYHELARKLGEINGQLNYPVVVILNEELEIIHQQVGYIAAKSFIKLLENVKN